jgi:ribosomal protein L37AE/L43A
MTVHEFEKRPRVVDVPEPDAFACPRCGERVEAYATRCSSCNVHFAGPAYQVASRAYTPPSLRQRFRRWIVLLVALLAALLAMLLGRG